MMFTNIKSSIRARSFLGAMTAALAVLIMAGSALGQTIGSFIDERDGTEYKTVEIGVLVWMAENLNYAGNDAVTVGVCYENSADNCAKYGRLYRWVEAMAIAETYQTTLWSGSDVKHQGICPSGWHLPSDAEWDALIKHIDPSHTSGHHATAGCKLKSQTDWTPCEGISSTNEYGFSALPGGRSYKGSFATAGYHGYWWSSTESDATDARHRNMYDCYDDVSSNWEDKDYLFSVRCLSDAPVSINYRPSRSIAPRTSTVHVTVRNHTLHVRGSSAESSVRVSLIDMRGKSVAAFTARGDSSFSLGNIPAGRYFVEVREGARRERGSVIIGVR